jgi:23S rRNA (guanine2445-N2)-methyltransferase / 23S rRNA (guanine2069-N7)-methyltransferase
MPERFGYFVPCPKGVEPLLADELRAIGVGGVRPQRSGVLFAGTVADGLRVLMWTRLGSRVLLKLGEVDASSADSLYAGVAEIGWEDHLRATGTLAVDATGVNDALRNTQFSAVRVKDAVADRFRDRFGRRPSVDVRSPDVRINLAVRADKATISIDLAVDPLHRRGYREPGVQVTAPMKETLAASLLVWAGWPKIAEKGGPLVDPMCGSGTIAIEAALMAGDVAPGLLRGEPAAARWLGFDAPAWSQLVTEAEARRAARADRIPPITASDFDTRAVAVARRCVQRAGLEDAVIVERRELSTVAAPAGEAPGLVATNPPWGERLSDRRDLPDLYRALSEVLVTHFSGWRCVVASPDPALARALGIRQEGSQVLGTGKGAATVTLFDVEREPEVARTLAPGSEEFANRLGKMAKHHGKWAKRTGVTCYRIYDADLPDFAVAVDLYQGAAADDGKRWAHVSEYAAPANIDEQAASARLESAVEVVADVLGMAPGDVFVKRRARQKGASQYERSADEGMRAVVAEAGLLFEVNLSSYLDTGLFLDHRDTRALVRDMSRGKRFLNLFAYTGSVSVYAAAGGAASTTTTDLSATYLDWAGRNMQLNGFEGAEHQRIQRDTSEFLARARKREDVYDLVFCDPPTFSNSKRMSGTFDVQRDHASLIASIETVLAEKGVLVFSCNRRSFDLDERALADMGLSATDITAKTIPPDFSRRPNVHRCWVIERS